MSTVKLFTPRFFAPSTVFLRHVSRRRGFPAGGVHSLVEFVEHHAARFTDQELKDLEGEIPRLRLQYLEMTIPQFPSLPSQFMLLADLYEDAAGGTFGPVSDAVRREVAFALTYAATASDIISDHVPEIGYADDSLIVRSVLERHLDVFEEYCRYRQALGTGVTLDA